MRGPPTVPARPSGRTARSIKQAVRDLPGAQINRPARRRRADARPEQIRGKRSFGRFYLGPLQGRPSARSQPYRRRGLPGRHGTRLAPEGARRRGRVPSKRPGNAVPEDAKMAPTAVGPASGSPASRVGTASPPPTALRGPRPRCIVEPRFNGSERVRISTCTKDLDTARNCVGYLD